MNKVICIGGSQHNALGLARSFYENGIKPYGIIVGNNAAKSFVRKSKCWEKTYAVESEEAAITLLIKLFGNEPELPVIIPYSDGAAEIIDRYLDRLEHSFIVPSIDHKLGKITKLMNKLNQIEFAKKYNIPMAKSWIISLPATNLPSDLVFPCIVKPVVSTEGHKTDIRKCQSENDLNAYLSILANKGYSRILMQEFLKFDFEFGFIGSCCDHPAYVISRKLRTWPIIGGSNSYFQVISDKKIHDTCTDILYALRNEKYSGLFDIEMFCVGDRILLNEINWRNSGNSFIALGTGVHWAVVYYYSVIGQFNSQLKLTTTDTSQYAMNEATDLRHVIFGDLPFIQWWHDRAKVQSFALWYKKDLMPTFYQYAYLVKEWLMHRRNG